MADINLGVGAANSATGGYDIDNSLKFESDNSERISFTPSSAVASERRKHTISFWIKRTELGSTQYIYEWGGSEGDYLRNFLRFQSDDTLRFATSYNVIIDSDRVFRDTSAWYHIVIQTDTASASADGDTKFWMYINGELEKSSVSFNANDTMAFANNSQHDIGYTSVDNGSYGNFYLAEFHAVGGLKVAPTDFAETDDDSGIWIPKEYTGSYGTNGFYLDFENSSSLGADASGNSNNFTLNNIAAGDQASDSPTNNFCILNPNWVSANKLIPTNGGTVISGNNGWSGYKGSMGVKTGKWYFEVVKATGGTNANGMWGVGDDGTGPNSFNDDNAHEVGYKHLFYQESTYGYRIYTNSSGSAANDFNPGVSNSVAEGDVFGVALDMDNGKISFYKNGSNMYGSTLHDLGGLATSSIYEGSVVPLFVNYSSLRELHVNFGGYCYTTPSSAASDANGYGNFEYAPPSGYYALCSKNIGQYDSPTIDDSSAHYQGLAYTGDSSSTTSADRNLTNTGNSDLQPDWIWLFNRDTQLTGGQKILDSNRGAGSGKSLSSSIPNAAGYQDAAYGYVNAFNSDGFGVRAGTDTNRWFVDRGDGGGDRYVAFQWKANGGTTSSNTSGSITSTVQNNSNAGFSIVTFTGDGNNDATIGHGLGVKPEMIITKNVDESVSWRVWHKDLTANHMLFLNSNNVETDTNAHGNGYIKAVSTTTYTVYQGTTNTLGVNGSSDTMVAYCFASKQGFSMFGEYRGNGATDGEFVYTGFKPAFLLLKRRDASGYHFRLYSSAQSPTNEVERRMTPNLAEAEGYHATDMSLDFYSNGFKFKTSNQINVNSGDYVFMAFAENPFAASTGIPTTAR